MKADPHSVSKIFATTFPIHFYKLLSLLPPQFAPDHQSAFHYLNQGGSPDVDGVDDLRAFEETLNALNLLGFTQAEQDDTFRVLAAVLHLGNIRFRECLIETENEQDQEGCAIDVDDAHMKTLCELLGVDGEEMRLWLCTRRLVSMRDVFMKPMTVGGCLVKIARSFAWYCYQESKQVIEKF